MALPLYHAITNKDQLENVITIKIIAIFCYINRYLVTALMEAIILLCSVVVWQYLELCV